MITVQTLMLKFDVGMETPHVPAHADHAKSFTVFPRDSTGTRQRDHERQSKRVGYHDRHRKRDGFLLWKYKP
jgi:hypothetical protein